MDLNYKIALLICATIYTSSAQADLLLGLNAGWNYWLDNHSGDLGSDPQRINDLRFGNSSDTGYNSYYLDIELTSVPEIQFSFTDINTAANSTSVGTFDLGSNSYPAPTELETNFDLQTTDPSLYWQLSDNLFDTDVGITGRYIDARVSVNDGLITDAVELSSVIPLAFIRARFDLPFTGWYLEGDSHLVKYSSDGYSDSAIKLGWQTDSLADFGLNIGYREMSLQVENFDGISTDLNISGPFASATFHF